MNPWVETIVSALVGSVLGAIASLVIAHIYHRKALRESKEDRQQWMRDFGNAKEAWMNFQLQNALYLQNNAHGRAWDVQLASDHSAVLLKNLKDTPAAFVEFAELGSARLIRADSISGVWALEKIEPLEMVELRFSGDNRDRRGFIIQWTDPSFPVPDQSCLARFTQALYFNPFELLPGFPDFQEGVPHGKYRFHTPFPPPYLQLDEHYVREYPNSTTPPFPRDFVKLETEE